MNTVKRVLIGLLLLWASPALAMEHYTDVLRDNKGLAIKDATVHVYNAGTLTYATLYSDNGITVKANPFTTSHGTNDPGAYDFYAANGAYDIVFVKTAFSFNNALTRRIALFDVADGGGGGGGGGGPVSFDDIENGTNTTATMLVGTGAALAPTGSGTISANRYNGSTLVQVADGGTNLSSATDDAVMVGNGTTFQLKVIPDCDNAVTSKVLYDTTTNTFTCGTDQTVATVAFNNLTTGSNTTAAMTVDTGASLTYAGSGSINASTYRGNATIAVADGGTNLTLATDDAVMVGNGTTFQLKVIADCDDPVNSKLLYDAATNAFSCGTDQAAGGGTTFNSIGNGTNTTAAMVVGTGASLVTSGTGILAASHLRPHSLTVNAGNSPYTATSGNLHLFCDTTLAGRSITLPAATETARLYVYNLGNNACTINRAGADTINTGLTSGTSFVINNAGSNFWLQPDGGTVWYVGG
jgi:hypothetical protein